MATHILGFKSYRLVTVCLRAVIRALIKEHCFLIIISNYIYLYSEPIYVRIKTQIQEENQFYYTILLSYNMHVEKLITKIHTKFILNKDYSSSVQSLSSGIISSSKL